MQEMWHRVKPDTLKKLRESAIIHSAESSNRIEGVTVDKGRLLPLVQGKTTPRDRPEEEIQGYRKALDYIHKNYDRVKISPRVIQKIHRIAQEGSISDAGKWKTKNNDIIEIDARGERSVRFRPLSASKTPKAIEQLCLGYHQVHDERKLPDLICTANFVLDFLCIHPFRDGNGRVARLLSLLLLCQQGYEVGKYISLEKLIEESKLDYYEALKESSQGWHKENFNLMPWWNYFLGVVRTAYGGLKERVEFSSGDSKSEIIRQVAMSFHREFSVSDILKLQPGIGRELVKKVLFKMKQDGEIELVGKGRGSKWKVL